MRRAETVEPLETTLLADNWGRLTRYRFRLKLRSGEWQEQVREAYDRGHGVACLLHDAEHDTVLLTRQFRLPVYVDGGPGYLVEVPAGLLEVDDPAEGMRRELEEETGYSVAELSFLFDVYMSPGSVTERLSFFLGSYTQGERAAAGGGKAEEGEDIETLHVPLRDAMAMIATGEIRDAKTIILLQRLALDRRASA